MIYVFVFLLQNFASNFKKQIAVFTLNRIFSNYDKFHWYIIMCCYLETKAIDENSNCDAVCV